MEEKEEIENFSEAKDKTSNASLSQRLSKALRQNLYRRKQQQNQKLGCFQENR